MTSFRAAKFKRFHAAGDDGMQASKKSHTWDIQFTQDLEEENGYSVRLLMCLFFFFISPARIFR